MCGIFFSISTNSTLPTAEANALLQKRGPDSYQKHTVLKGIPAQDGVSQPLSHHLTFISTVLSLRGDHIFNQPLVDLTTESVLCWNGEAWKISGERVRGNDTQQVFKLFLDAVSCDRNKAIDGLSHAVASITGPFAFVFYDAINSRVFFSRDCLGRRSLLQGLDEDGALKICSLCDGSSSSTLFEEVNTRGVSMIDLEMQQDPSSSTNGRYKIETLPWSSDSSPPERHIVSVQMTTLKTPQVLTEILEKPHTANEHVHSRDTASSVDHG